MVYKRNNRCLSFSAVFIVLFLKNGMACQMEELAFEIQTTGRIPCRHNIPPDLIDFVGWTKSTREDCYENGDRYVVAWNGDRIIQDQNYGIDIDFSLVIPDVTTTFIGIYRCTVLTKEDTLSTSQNDTRLTVYKYPDNPPSIAYQILGGNEIEINCTHGPVFPLLYPSFPFPNHNNHTNRNQDGTYMVSINAVLQFSGNDITLYCSHSYPGQHRSSFLNVLRSDNKQDDYATHPPDSKTTLMSSSIHTELTPEQSPHDSTSTRIILVILVLMMVIMMASCLGLVVIFCIIKSIQKPVQDLGKQEMAIHNSDGRPTHESEHMFMLLLLMKELEEVKDKLGLKDPELCQRSGKVNRLTADDDNKKEDERKNLLHYLKEIPEKTPLMTIQQEEDGERIEIGVMPIVNHLGNIHQEPNGMLLELADRKRQDGSCAYL